jgi:hypothetical protein
MVPIRAVVVNFDDVRISLGELDVAVGPLGGEPCPGWREPA